MLFLTSSSCSTTPPAWNTAAYKLLMAWITLNNQNKQVVCNEVSQFCWNYIDNFSLWSDNSAPFPCSSEKSNVLPGILTSPFFKYSSTHSCSRTGRQGPPRPPPGSLLEQKRQRHLLLLGQVAHGRAGCLDGWPMPGGQSRLCGAPRGHRRVSEERAAGWGVLKTEQRASLCWRTPTWFSRVSSSFSCLSRAEVLSASTMMSSLSWVSLRTSLSLT